VLKGEMCSGDVLLDELTCRVWHGMASGCVLEEGL
jgi:hypothetical protein